MKWNWKRIVSSLLLLAMLAGFVPAIPAQAAESDIATADTGADMESMITQQYDAYIKGLGAEGASESAMSLVKHSIKNGGTLNMDESHIFAKALLSSNLFRADIIHASAVAAQTMQSHSMDKLFMRGVLNWYEHKSNYSNSVWIDNENGDESDDVRMSPSVTAKQNPYNGQMNAYDEAMYLVTGSTHTRLTYQQVSIGNGEATYRVKIRVYDNFDFNSADYSNKGKYSYSDASLAYNLTYMGKLLSLGLLHTFNWYMDAEFEFTVPNTCHHSSSNYSLEYDGAEDLVSSTVDGYMSNSLRKTSGTVEDGYFADHTRYILEKPIRLYHDKPWCIEMKCQGTGYIWFYETTVAGNQCYLRKAANTMYFSEYKFLNETDEKRTTTSDGIWFTKTKGVPKVSSEDEHTYRLENRVYEDGSNMVYLYVDGIEHGSMDNYYINSGNQKTTRGWVNGRDLVYTKLILRNIRVPYIRIWENGEDQEPFTYYVTSEVQPTCTEQGYTLHTCTMCSATYKSEIVGSLGHDFSEWETVKASTCAENGTQVRVCNTCGYEERQALELLEHTMTAVVTQPDCTNRGYTTYTCGVCGDVDRRHYVDALGHSYGTWEAVKEPTCTETGTKERECEVCGWVDSEEIPALGHSYTDTIYDPTCEQQGYTEHICQVCGDSYQDSYTDALGHSYGEWYVEKSPECETEGVNRRDCEVCGGSEREDIPATGHSYQVSIRCPGCETEGYTQYTCTDCAYSYQDDITAATGHSYQDKTVDATCTEGGYVEHSCEFCSSSYRDEQTDALGHAWGEWVTETQLTCTVDGFLRRTCGNCGRQETKILEAEGHEYKESVTAPTCTKRGYTTHTCQSCGDSYQDSYTDALGHDAVTDEAVAATCTENGLTEGSHCDRCAKVLVKQKTVFAEGHSYTAKVTKATCEKKGYTTHTCDTCGHSYKDAYTKAKGHRYDRGVCGICGGKTAWLDAPVIEVENVASSGKIRVSWEKVNGATKYALYRSEDGVNFTRLITTAKTSVLNTSAKAGTKYHYYAVALDDQGTKSEKSGTVSLVCDLAQPKVKAVNVASSGKIKLTWEKVDGAVSYAVYRANAKDGTYAKVKTTTATSYSDTTAVTGRTYYYKVRAICADTAGNSAYSAIRSKVCDLAQPVVTLSRNAKGNPVIKWNAIEGAIKYEVWYATSKNGTYKKLITTKNTKVVNSSAVAGKTYYYKVRAIHSNSSANSAYSAVKYIKAK